MKKKIYYMLSFLLLALTAQLKSENIIPYVSVSASSSEGIMQSTNLVNASGLSALATNATHDNAPDGSSMWQGKASILDVTLTFDLKQNYNLKDLYVWNFNQQSNTDKGLKNIRISYSSTGSTWTLLPAPSNPGYEVNASYPFQLARANGAVALPATNLNDGNNTPIDLRGINARYVRFTISQTAGTGNWSSVKTFGLSEVMFTTDDTVEDILNITVNSANEENRCGNMVFGGCHNPSYAHSQQILPMLVDAGFNNVRSDMWLETILPQDITYEDYLNNVNDVQNPDTWNYSNLELAVRAKSAGMNVMMIISYCPAWLTYNGTTKGMPKDLDVYADIVQKIYSRYYKYIDWVEVYNEPGYFFTIEGSPYSSTGKALADIYMTCEKVVHAITPDMPMGGTSVVTSGDGGVGGSTNRDFFSDSRINKNNFNFYSHHVYSDYGVSTVKETVTRVKSQLAKFGYEDLPIYFTEWSQSINNKADSAFYTGTKAHLFAGNCLLNWMRDGITGAQHWNYLQAIADDGGFEAGISTDAHGMYAWNARTKQGRLLPKAYTFKLLSKTLGLGIGENKIVETASTTDSNLNIVSFVNAEGVSSTVFVNEGSIPIKIKMNYVGYTPSKVESYAVTFYDKGETPENINFTTSDGVTTSTITIEPMAVVGIKYIK